MTALAASRRLSCSALSNQPTAARLSRSCASSRAPIITEETVRRDNRRDAGRNQRQRGEAEPAIDGDGAGPGAERIAEIERGDVEA